MSGTQIFTLGLILVAGLLILLALSLRSKTPTTAKFSMEKVFSFEFSVSPEAKDRAVDDAAAAAATRGQSGEEAATEVRSRLSTIEQLRLQRTLWVDDNPDNNIFESLALMRLGLVITAATSNDAARRFMSEVEFDLVITDLGRKGTSDDGARLVGEIHQKAGAPPVIVYTASADERRSKLIAQGASAVEDRPGALIAAVLATTS